MQANGGDAKKNKTAIKIKLTQPNKCKYMNNNMTRLSKQKTSAKPCHRFTRLVSNST